MLSLEQWFSNQDITYHPKINHEHENGMMSMST